MNKLYITIIKTHSILHIKDSFIIIMDVHICIVVTQPNDINKIVFQISQYCSYSSIFLSAFLCVDYNISVNVISFSDIY